MSQNSLAAIELASDIAKHKLDTIVFMYVAPQWIQDNAMLDDNYSKSLDQADENAFGQLRPTHESVPFEHLFLHGNAGPIIVEESEKCDLVVLSTHGRTGLKRLLVGSVAQYVMRNAKCPVITVQNSGFSKGNSASLTEPNKRYVTEAMHQIAPIHDYDRIEDVIRILDRFDETAAPVVNEQNKTIGVLTKTDIKKYHSLHQRLDARDPSVVSEVFEVNQFGNYRVGNEDFEQVKRHMSSPAVTILNTRTIDDAIDVFAKNQNIHHLVVVDGQDHPLGILEPRHCVQRNNSQSQQAETRETGKHPK
jgi:nucleotide-binding universal stress UspA family protein/CBS domain-containing protein